MYSYIEEFKDGLKVEVLVIQTVSLNVVGS